MFERYGDGGRFGRLSMRRSGWRPPPRRFPLVGGVVLVGVSGCCSGRCLFSGRGGMGEFERYGDDGRFGSSGVVGGVGCKGVASANVISESLDMFSVGGRY